MKQSRLSPEEMEYCGISFDHEEELFDEGDGERVYICNNCQAELIEYYEEDEE